MRLDPDEARRRFATGRVAYLATLRADGTAAQVPIVFEVSGDRVVSVVDPKPKRTPELVRLQHIAHEPRVALLADHYEDDWQRLWWARAEGLAPHRASRPRAAGRRSRRPPLRCEDHARSGEACPGLPGRPTR